MLSAVILFTALGCTGTIEGGSGTSSGGPSDGSDGGGIGASHGYTKNPGLRRLTRVEYRNTVRDLLGVEVDVSRIPKELLIRGHSVISGAQKTGYTDIEAYYDLALRTAESAAPEILDRTSCDSSACLVSFADDFLPLAFRGATDADTEQAYRALLTDDAAGATTRERLTTFLSAVLSSPHFLYRQEIGRGDGGESGELAPHEIATRLSYLVWQSTPDAELLAAGESLRTPEGRTAQLARMLRDARAREGMRGFVRDWMGVFDNRIPSKDSAVLAGLPADAAQAAEESFERAIDAEASSFATAGYLALLTTDRVFTNATIDAIYGVESSDTEPSSTAIPTEHRIGLLTHPMVLASHTKESGASPFPIGHFIYENVLCETIPPPPPGIPAVPDDEENDRTLRETLESLTTGEPCHSCHMRIGPPGFAFLPFDPVGRFRATDGRDRPFDTSGELVLPGGNVPFADTVGMIRTLADQEEVAHCIAKRIFRFAHGRFEASFDTSEIADLAAASAESRAHVQTLLERIVTAPSFTQVRVVR